MCLILFLNRFINVKSYQFILFLGKCHVAQISHYLLSFTVQKISKSLVKTLSVNGRYKIKKKYDTIVDFINLR